MTLTEILEFEHQMIIAYHKLRSDLVILKSQSLISGKAISEQLDARCQENAQKLLDAFQTLNWQDQITYYTGNRLSQYRELLDSAQITAAEILR